MIQKNSQGQLNDVPIKGNLAIKGEVPVALLVVECLIIELF